jgi:leucyl-tRNA synthetase
MELVNELYAFSEQTVTGGPSRRNDEDVEHAGQVERPETIHVVREALEALVRMLSPFAPHMSEEMWEALGYSDGLAAATWPEFDPVVAKAEEIEIPVQINGKVRAHLMVPPDIAESALEGQALADPTVKTHLAGKTVKKVVVVKGRLVSIVVQ